MRILWADLVDMWACPVLQAESSEMSQNQFPPPHTALEWSDVDSQRWAALLDLCDMLRCCADHGPFCVVFVIKSSPAGLDSCVPHKLPVPGQETAHQTLAECLLGSLFIIVFQMCKNLVHIRCFCVTSIFKMARGRERDMKETNITSPCLSLTSCLLSQLLSDHMLVPPLGVA